jgi:hypothetical protein
MNEKDISEKDKWIGRSVTLILKFKAGPLLRQSCNKGQATERTIPVCIMHPNAKGMRCFFLLTIRIYYVHTQSLSVNTKYVDLLAYFHYSVAALPVCMCDAWGCLRYAASTTDILHEVMFVLRQMLQICMIIWSDMPKPVKLLIRI